MGWTRRSRCLVPALGLAKSGAWAEVDWWLVRKWAGPGRDARQRFLLLSSLFLWVGRGRGCLARSFRGRARGACHSLRAHTS
ncbi:uncharacterized protein K452DRAFT_56465 [Aplosporella prunicola CBS 121167]|uniref:Uncharacterized protein n=1 Tax=Aplosporella prunicola CBS 121167 TaxID=1176127 RepID=A0A6A6B724_9PEZI|nr:uncharacterized protein K452DRAFT_56465 [Aplosporella prunicola CBS 121167]KAF2139820.1 hypothetical protein K452DRAFT_56465 [Aplosporella prunicola CBS 121167]